jgi:hypothetical protein
MPPEAPPPFIVFAQADTALFPLEQTRQYAARFFSNAVVTTGEGPLFTLAPETGAVFLRLSQAGTDGDFVVRPRAVTPADVDRAREAERRGRAGGMSDLAARCRSVWVLEPAPSVPPWLVLECCALLASVGLGPVLPPEGDTLLGVRSARERAEKLRRAAETSQA